MINEITITAKFVMGTTMQDPDQARKNVKWLFLQALKEVGIMPQEKGSGLFSVEILEVESKKI